MRSDTLLFIAFIPSGSPTGLEFTHNLTSEKDITLLTTRLNLNLSIRPRGKGIGRRIHSRLDFAFSQDFETKIMMKAYGRMKQLEKFKIIRETFVSEIGRTWAKKK
jgi:hypothetical protein